MSDETEGLPQLPEGCGYTGHDFGASYIDSECFGGRLYDLDNGEPGGVLYEPGEYIPCPSCCMEEWIEREAAWVAESISGNAKSSLPQWKRAVRYALKINRDAALDLLSGKFRVVKYVAINADDTDFDEMTWEFDESDLCD